MGTLIAMADNAFSSMFCHLLDLVLDNIANVFPPKCIFLDSIANVHAIQ